MKKNIFLVFIICNVLSVDAQDVYPTQSQIFMTDRILANVFHISTDTMGGTSFLTIHNGKEYLVTARHLFKRTLRDCNTTSVKLDIGGQAKTFKAIYHIKKDKSLEAADIAVLELNESIKKIEPYELNPKVIVGQDVYFLGYPVLSSGSFYTIGTTPTEFFPIVKKGILSGLNQIDGNGIYFIDGHNNPGFSGGPVICRDTHKAIPSDNIIILGIISGYWNEEKTIIDKKNNKAYQDYITLENSGIIKCVPSDLATIIIEEIKK